MNLTIKKLTLDQLPELVAIHKEVLREDFPEYRPRVSSIYQKHIFNQSYFRKLIKKKTSLVFGAFFNNKLRGFLSIKLDFGGVAHFDWLVVKKDFRNQGVGTALLKAGEKWCLKNYIHYVYLYTESKKNIEFYKRKGFKYIGLHRQSWFGVSEHVMRKHLRNKPFEEIFKKYKL